MAKGFDGVCVFVNDNLNSNTEIIRMSSFLPVVIANMNYAGVSGAVITQEYIDGNQDEYLLSCKSDRIKM